MGWTEPRDWVTGEVVTAANMNTHVRDNFLVVGSALLLPVMTPPQLLTPQGFLTLSAATAAVVDRLYAVPLTVPGTTTFDRIILLGSEAVGNARMGIYSSSAGAPGALILDAGAVALGAVNTTITISQELTGPEKYWLAIVFDSTPNVAVAQPVGIAPWAELTFTYAALPNPYGTVNSYILTGTAAVPQMALRTA